MNTETKILDREDLQRMFGIKGLPGKMVAGLAYRILRLKRANSIQAKYADLKGSDFAKAVLREIGVNYEIDPEALAAIPAEGGFITVSNHPYGGLDGLILMAEVGARRPDFKILTTYFMSLIPSLRDSFIPVDNFSSGGVRSIQGIKMALEHLSAGNPLGLFPAGEVSTWQHGANRTSTGKGRVTEDIPWATNVVKLARKTGFPIIPVYFDGENSKMFHILGQIHPRLRTVRLVKELFSKEGTTVKVRIGKPVTTAETASLDLESYGKYLRSRCYSLESLSAPAAAHEAAEVRQELAAPVDPSLIRAEIEAIADKKLFDYGDYSVYFIKAQQAPHVMEEIYRLREDTFRRIGEGTGNANDTDEYDSYYRHLILWNVTEGEIAGAYRMGFGREILQEHGGIKGLYTASLFSFKEGARKFIEHGIELGRSFIQEKYQKDTHTLRLLFAGLIVGSLKCPGSQWFIGPVSISNDFPDFYKSLIVHFMDRTIPMPGREEIAAPTHPFIEESLRVNLDDLLKPAKNNIDTLNRVMGVVSGGKYRVPVLIRKYVNGGAKVVCFNVDPLFSNCLDALVLMNFPDFPREILETYLYGLPESLLAEVVKHYYGNTAAA